MLIAHEGQYVDYSRPPHPASHFLWEWGTRLCLSTACRAHTCKRGFELALLQLLQHTCDIRRGAKNHNCSMLTSTTHAASSHFISAFEQLKKENASPLKWVRNLPNGSSQLFTASHVPYEYKQNSSEFHKDKDKSSFTCCTLSWCKRRKIRITSLATVSKHLLHFPLTHHTGCDIITPCAKKCRSYRGHWMKDQLPDRNRTC